MVYVISIDGKPLMPTNRHGKVRRLLKAGLAKPFQMNPFTIQLLYKTETEVVDYLTLGLDPGTKKAGVSVTSKKKELFRAEYTIRSDIKELMETRKGLRRKRRSFKRRRPARFNNRARKEGWLTPTVTNKHRAHERIVNEVKKILPIKKVVIESGQFDFQKLTNPEITGKEYQEGRQKGFNNTREYILYRDKHTCQFCDGKSKDKILELHHIESRKTGSNNPDNLITLCKTCHTKIHKKGWEYKLKPLKEKGYLQPASHFNIMRKSLLKLMRETFKDLEIIETFGYITKSDRISLGLPKSHTIDARCISGNLNVLPSDKEYKITFYRRHNRQLQKAKMIKGGKIVYKKPIGNIGGFELHSRVKIKGTVGFVSSLRRTGSLSVKGLDGKLISGGISYKKLKLLGYSKGMKVV